jgi:hypothetical protein
LDERTTVEEDDEKEAAVPVSFGFFLFGLCGLRRTVLLTGALSNILKDFFIPYYTAAVQLNGNLLITF